MSTASNPYLFPAPALSLSAAALLLPSLRRFFSRWRREAPTFALGQKVAWGTPPHTHTGKFIAVIPQPDEVFPLLRIRYYDDPARFGHPVPVEIELPAQLVRPVHR